MNRMLSVVMVLTLVICMVSPAKASTNVELTVTSANKLVGEVFTVEVRLKTGSQVISGGQFVLTYDKSMLEVARPPGVKQGPLLGSSWVVLTNEDHRDGISCVWASGGSQLQAVEGVILTVAFKALKAGNARVGLASVTLKDASVATIAASSIKIGAGQIVIQEPVVEPAPPPVTPPAPVAPTTPVSPTPVTPEPPVTPVTPVNPVDPPKQPEPVTPEPVKPTDPPVEPTPPVVVNPKPDIVLRSVIGSKTYALNGAQKDFDSFTAFYGAKGISVMALRMFAELGAEFEYEWAPQGGRITMSYDNIVVKLQENSDVMEIIEGNTSRTIKLRTAVVNRYGRAFIPTRDVSEYFGFLVEWDASDDSVTIKRK